MPSRRSVLALLAALPPGLAVLRPGPLSAQSARVFSEGEVAIRGADPVAYFEQGRYVAGSPDIALKWRGAMWRFASLENRATFERNPRAYAPQYGGYCAYAVSQGYTASIDPEAWQIVNGKLYLNYSHDIQRKWQQDAAGYIAAADRNWPDVLKQH